ncbi:MAG: BatD family protein, partial [Phycisphaerae bacterium]
MLPTRLRLSVAVITVTAGTFLAPASGYAARLVGELRPSRIYLGTQTLLTVEVINARNAGWPTVSSVTALDIQRYGRPSVRRDLFSGRTTARYQFIVTPQRTGTFRIPEISLTVGGTMLKDGPFTLVVGEAPFRFRTAKIDPPEILVGDTATLEVFYEGVRPGAKPVVPDIDGLRIRPMRIGRVEVRDRDGLPITIHTFEVQAEKLGSFEVSGITFDGVPADPVTLRVSPFVVVGTQVGESSLVVGSRTTVHVLIRGLPQSTKLKLVGPEGIRIAPSAQRYRSRETGSLFSFDVTATEPGNFAIDTIELPGGRQVVLAEPLTLAVRQSGTGDIFACRGVPSSEETVVGEPFTVDYEVYFRGDFQGAAVDLSQALFASKDYIKVEPVNRPSYPDWGGVPVDGRLDDRRVRMLLGGGEYNGQKEQLLRFALKITPLATGELSLDGLRVVLLLQIKEERRTANTFFSSSQTRQFARVAEVPPHFVIDPPGITRPPTYRGAVGKSFAFVTELDRTSATAMSPLTLTMKISGESVGPNFVPPPLGQVPELTRDFDVSSTVDGGEVDDGTITFTQVVRPRSEEVTELPALPLVYYEYEQKEYETVYSLPIPIEVRPGSLVGAAAMETVTDTSPPPDTRRSEQARREPMVSLGANHATLGDVVVAPLNFGGVLAVLVSGPACVIVVITGRWAYRRRKPRAAVRQQKRELVHALGRLDATGDFYVRLADILQS